MKDKTRMADMKKYHNCVVELPIVILSGKGQSFRYAEQKRSEGEIEMGLIWEAVKSSLCHQVFTSFS